MAGQDATQIRLEGAGYHFLAEHSKDIALLLDVDVRILDANKEATRSYGRDLQKLVGLRICCLRRKARVSRDDRTQLRHARGGRQRAMLFDLR